jgi:hypothetical protein
MTTLASATLDTAKLLTRVLEGTATGGSATTVVDTGSFDPYPDDWWNNGTIWLRSGNNSGKSAIITDWDQSDETWTFPTLTLLCAANDLYSVAGKLYPRYMLIQAVNAAMQTIGGDDDDYEDSSYVTVADQTAYALPAGVYNVKRVLIAGSTVSPYGYWVHHLWREMEGYIKFDPGAEIGSAGYRIKLIYNVAPTAVTADTDAILSNIHIDRLKWEAALHAAQLRLSDNPEDGQLEQRIEKWFWPMVQQMRLAHPVEQMPRDPHLQNWGGVPVDTTTFTGTVRLK